MTPKEPWFLFASPWATWLGKTVNWAKCVQKPIPGGEENTGVEEPQAGGAAADVTAALTCVVQSPSNSQPF